VRSVRCCWCIMDLSVGGTLFDLFFFYYTFLEFFFVCYLTCVPLGDEFKVLDRFCVTSNFSSHFFFILKSPGSFFSPSLLANVF
jgi:hypothetical protein